jgi:lipid-A-disaccharide synthase-like uncharacterized protein
MESAPLLATALFGFELHAFELNTWKIIGLSGSIVFGLRFILQGINLKTGIGLFA